MILPCWTRISEIPKDRISTLNARVLILSCNSLSRVIQYLSNQDSLARQWTAGRHFSGGRILWL